MASRTAALRLSKPGVRAISGRRPDTLQAVLDVRVEPLQALQGRLIGLPHAPAVRLDEPTDRVARRLGIGGLEPLAATLVAALEVAQQARRRGLHNVVLVLLTDARANVGIRADRAGVDDELRSIAVAAAATGLKSLVIDTQRSYLSQGSAQKLAAWLGGRYLYLPGADGGAIAAAARSAA